MAQVVALVMLAQLGGSAGPTGITSLEVGRFLSMTSCQRAVGQAVTIHPLPDAKVSFICVPLTPNGGGR